MKNPINSLRLVFSGLILAFFLSGCGGNSTSTNQHLGKLPGIAKKYKDKIGNKKKELKACTDLEKAFKLDKEIKLLKEKSDKTIKEYLTSTPIANVPFEQKADYPFIIRKVWVESASNSRINFKAHVTIVKDILNNWGTPPGFSRNLFAYFKAVDKEGNSLTRNSVFGSISKGPYKANMEVDIAGSLLGLTNMVTFEKLVFISEEDYRKSR